MLWCSKNVLYLYPFGLDLIGIQSDDNAHKCTTEFHYHGHLKNSRSTSTCDKKQIHKRLAYIAHHGYYTDGILSSFFPESLRCALRVEDLEVSKRTFFPLFTSKTIERLHMNCKSLLSLGAPNDLRRDESD